MGIVFPFCVLSLLPQGGAITSDKVAFPACIMQAESAISNICPSYEYAS